MPELPEVETVRRQLNVVLAGKQIADVEVLRAKSFQSDPRLVVDRVIEGVGRKGKVLAIMTTRHEARDDEGIVLMVHLKMTGQLIYEARGDVAIGRRVVGGHPTQDWVGTLPSKHTRVIVRFTDNSTLFFNDQRVFGWMKVMADGEWRMVREKMPPDVIDPEFTVDYLYRTLQRSARPVKLVVMNSSLIGGAGNIYANDALYISRIHPKMPANQLKYDAVKNLHMSLLQVINRGIETGGASYSHFVDTEGLGGNYQEEFLVYSKEGQRCLRCSGVIEKIKLGGRGTYFCPQCQS